MATSTRTDFTVYEEQFQGGFIETIYQNVQAFNAASRGALAMRVEELVGHYEQEAMWDEISSIARRDSSADSSSTVSSTKLTQDEFVGVKLDRRNGPYEVNLDAFRKIGEEPAPAFSRVIGVQTAEALPQEQLDRALAALEAKLDATTALEHDRTAGTMRTQDLVDGLSKRGDAAGDVLIWVMHSKPFYDLLKEQVTSSNSIFSSEIFASQIFGGTAASVNRPILVTDSASLKETDGVSSGVDKYSTLGLTARAAEIVMSEPPVAVMDGPETGSENLFLRWQAEYSYNLRLRGVKWDTTSGGKNPTNAAVATATNWDDVVSDNKGLPGVIVTSR